MVDISLLEKIAINVFTPAECLVRCVRNTYNFICNPDEFAYYPSNLKIWSAKIEYYERLISALKKDPDKRIVEEYMYTSCGRIQVWLAVAKGLIPKNEYEQIKSKHKCRFIDLIQF